MIARAYLVITTPLEYVKPDDRVDLAVVGAVAFITAVLLLAIRLAS